MRGISRSLSVPIGLAWVLMCSPQLTSPALAQGLQGLQDAPKAPEATALKTSGAGDLRVAYQLALLAHMDSVLGNDSAAAADLHSASEHLALAQLAVSATQKPSSSSAGSLMGAPGSLPGSQQEQGGTPGSRMTPGGGGGPTTGLARPMTPEPEMATILGALQTLADSTQSDISPESTTRLVAAMTGEFVQMGRAGGGGGPAATMPTQMTAIEHIGEAYALVGQAQTDVAVRNFDEAHGALGQAAIQLDAARKAPGGKQLSHDISRMSAAVKDATGAVAGKRHTAAEATMRAVREITTSLTALAATTAGTADQPSGTP